jgi:hypothetical protein
MLALALLLAGCSRSSEPTEGDVIVYVAVPLSGFQANGGQTILGGVRLAAAEINRNGGLLGYRVVVRSLDDESDSDVAVTQAGQVQSALDQGERVIGVIGHLNSGQTLATMELYKNFPIVVITPTASEKSLTERGFTNFFRVNAKRLVLDSQSHFQALAQQAPVMASLGRSLTRLLLELLEPLRLATGCLLLELGQHAVHLAVNLNNIQVFLHWRGIQGKLGLKLGQKRILINGRR